MKRWLSIVDDLSTYEEYRKHQQKKYGRDIKEFVTLDRKISNLQNRKKLASAITDGKVIVRKRKKRQLNLWDFPSVQKTEKEVANDVSKMTGDTGTTNST